MSDSSDISIPTPVDSSVSSSKGGMLGMFQKGGIVGYADGGVVPINIPGAIDSSVGGGGSGGGLSAMSNSSKKPADDKKTSDTSSKPQTTASGVPGYSGGGFIAAMNEMHNRNVDRRAELASRKSNSDYLGALSDTGENAPAPTNQAQAIPVAPQAQNNAAPPAANVQAQPDAALPAPASTSGVPTTLDNSNAFHSAVEDFSGHLHGGSLNDSSVPHADAATAVPTPQNAVSTALNNPGTKQGIPEDAPAKAHSLTPDYWKQSDAKLIAATQAAAMAGHDPNEVYKSLNNVRTAFVQSHMLRNAATAYTALQNGDDKGVEQAIRNINYYLPNGQDLEVHHGSNGQLQYVDPLNPTKPDPSNPDKAVKNFVDVTPMHIQLLGQALLDPQNVNTMISNVRSGMAKQNLENMEARAKVMTAQAALGTAGARQTTAKAREALVPATAFEKFAHGKVMLNDLNSEVADAPDPKLAAKQAELASKQFLDMRQGLQTTAPVYEVDSKGRKVTSMSPVAGKTYRDPTKVPKDMQGLSDQQATEGAGMAGSIAAANAGTMAGAEAARIAGRVMQLRQPGKMTTHMDPTTQKAEPDFKVDAASNTGWLWNGSSWQSFKMHQSLSGAMRKPQSTLGRSNEGGTDLGEELDKDDQEMSGDGQ